MSNPVVSPRFYETTELPAWTQMTDNAPAPGEIVWSGKVAPPAIGSHIVVRMNGCGPAIVTGYFVEEGYLGLVCELTNAPEWHKKQNNNDPRGHVFGPEFDMPAPVDLPPQGVPMSRPGEALLPMDSGMVNRAAAVCVERYKATGKTEFSTRDFTAVYYPELAEVVIQWAVETPAGALLTCSETVELRLVDVPARRDSVSPAVAAWYRFNRARGYTAADSILQARMNAARGRAVPAVAERADLLDHGDVIRLRDWQGKPLTLVVAIAPDYAHGAPWKAEDGHGPVSGWTRDPKRPGERVLSEDGASRRYYDFQEAMRIARRDGWGIAPELRAKLEAEKGRPLTRGELAEEAVKQDFNRLRDWCLDRWQYVGVTVFHMQHDVEEYPDQIADSLPFGNRESESLWGIESDCVEYISTVARELAAELAARIIRHDI